jgi:hypothetical protein
MTDKLPPTRAPGTGGCPARHGRLPTVGGRADGAAAVPPAAVAPPMVSAAESPPSWQASPPHAAPPVAAALTTFAILTTFEGQAVFKILSPGSPKFRAGDVLRFAYGSRSTRARQP